MQKNKLLGKKNNVLWFLLTALIVGLTFYFFSKKCNMVYLTNDDMYLRMLSSGEISGNPESHLYYVGILSGILVSSLYRWFPGGSWYGLYLTISFAAGITFLLFGLLSECKRNLERILTLVVVGFAAYAFFFLHVAEIQFTTVTAMLGSAALVYFCKAKPSSAKGMEGFKETVFSYLPFMLLSFWAVSIRDSAWLMLLPFVGVIGLIRFIDSKSLHILFTGAVYFSLLVGLLLFDKAEYRTKEWQDFSKYTDASETLYDYTGYPDYQSNQTLYDSVSLSESEYEASYLHYEILLHPKINAQTMETLAKASEETTKKSWSEVPRRFWERHINYTDRPLNLIVYFLYAAVFIAAILAKKKSAVRNVLLVLLARMIVWVYLLYNGRYPTRVTQGIYLAEFAMLLSIAYTEKLFSISLQEAKRGFRKKILYAWWIACMICTIGLSSYFGLNKVEKGVGEAYARLVMSESYEDIRAYMQAHDEDRFFLDQNSFGSFTESVLHKDTSNLKDANYLLMGSWLPHSPWYETRLLAWGLDSEHLSEQALDRENHIYFVFMESEVTSSDYLEKFYQETYNATLIVTDTVETRGNIRFTVYEAVQ